MTEATTKRLRVLVVDDSAFARKVVREVLQSDARLEVVGIARDGLDALEKIVELAPDVITLDLVMPELDGIGVLDALREQPKPPRVVVVTMSDTDSPLGVSALERGAFDVVHKPTALATDRLYELRTASSAGNAPPLVSIVRPSAGASVAGGAPVAFEGTVSDPDGDAVTAFWTFGDTWETVALAGAASHAFRVKGV